MTYREYLLSQGASEEDVKVLDTPLGRKTFERMQAVEGEFTEFKTKATAYEERVGTWFEEEKAKRARLDSELVATRARAAASREALKAAQEKGLLDVSRDLGFNLDEPNPNPPTNNPAASNFDPNKYFTKDDVLSIAKQEGVAIATASAIAYEHARLFPDRPLDFEALYQRAVDTKTPLKQLWMTEFGVQAARDAAKKAAEDAAKAALRKSIEAEVRTELASQYGNPDVRPLAPSSSPFTMRKDTGRDKQPWETGFVGEGGSNDRVQRALQKQIQRSNSGVN
jgi:hypothetical protein